MGEQQMTNGQAGKGSKRRPCDEDQYRENYDKIFKKKRKKVKRKTKCTQSNKS
jgi:hypothetical protein